MNRSPESGDLWRRYREQAAAPAPVEIDALTLAAYVEGACDEATRDRVEAFLVRSPEALDAVLAASALIAQPLPPTSLDLIRWGREALPLSEVPASSGFVFSEWRRGLAWAGIAASLMIVSCAGFLAGADSAASAVGVQADVGLVASLGPTFDYADGDGSQSH